MKERRKRVKRVDGSLYRSKSTRPRWGIRGRGGKRGRETGRDWSVHERWVRTKSKSVVAAKVKTKGKKVL
jgi:hypothetical protein